MGNLDAFMDKMPFIGGGGSGGGGGFIASFSSSIKLIAEFAAFLALTAGIVIAVKWIISYKHKAEVFELDSKGHINFVTDDRGREYNRKDGENGFQLFKMRKELTLPHSDAKVRIGKKRYKVFILKVGDDAYFMNPSRLIDKGTEKESVVLKPIPSNVRHWGTLKRRQAAEKYAKPTWLEKYGTQLAFVVMAMVLMICIKWILEKGTLVTQAIGGHGADIKALAEAIKGMGLCKPPPAIP